MKIILSVVLVVSILLVTGLKLWQNQCDHLLWTAPFEEKICYLRTYNAYRGHVLVLSEKKANWYLRDISGDGKARLIASGTGRLQGFIPLTSPNWQDDKVLIGLRPSTLSHSIIECDLRTGKLKTIPILSRATTWNLNQPYSLDDRWLVLTGSVDRNNQHMTGSWLLDSKSRKLQPIRMSKTDVQHVGWRADGKFNIYFNHSGNLCVGNQTASKDQTKLPKGFIGYTLPSGDRLLIVHLGRSSLKVFNVDTRSGIYHTLYERSGKIASNASCLGVQCSPEHHNVVVDLSGPDVNPLLIKANGQTKEIKVSDSIRWRLSAGVAFINENRIAVVRKDSIEASDQIITKNL